MKNPFRRRPKPFPYTCDLKTQQPAVRCSICTGEMTSGYTDRASGKFHEWIRIDDLEEFKRQLGVDEVRIIY